jgi:hypothetical protein
MASSESKRQESEQRMLLEQSSRKHQFTDCRVAATRNGERKNLPFVANSTQRF